jgi:hypothetical protein
MGGRSPLPFELRLHQHDFLDVFGSSQEPLEAVPQGGETDLEVVELHGDVLVARPYTPTFVPL